MDSSSDLFSFSEGGSRGPMAPKGSTLPLTVKVKMLVEGRDLGRINQMPEGPVNWLGG